MIKGTIGQVICSQYIDSTQTSAEKLRCITNPDRTISIAVINEPLKFDQYAYDGDSLQLQLIEKLLEKGQVMSSPIGYPSLIITCNIAMNHIAMDTRRGTGNVIIANSHIYDKLNNTAFGNHIMFVECALVPNDIIIILFRGMFRDEVTKVDGAPIIAYNDEMASGIDFHFQWVGEEEIDKYVKIIKIDQEN